MNDIQKQVQNIASKGRYGDTMLMHVNPQEVKGLASAMPLTVNPETGQPEAFLPFLAPLLGSWLGTAFLPTLIPALAGKAALASGIGAGLATYAQTGGSGSKALLSGLTAGFGTNAANTAAQGAETAALTAGMSPEAATAAIQAAPTRTATGAFDALKDTFMSGPDKTFAFDQGAKALASGAMSPSGMVAGAGLGARGIIESQEAFARQMGESEEEYRRRREEMYRNNPEPTLYSASGGLTQFDDNMIEMYGPMQPMANGGVTKYNGGGPADVGPDDFTYGELPQIFAPARTAYDVNPDFMPGFAPETMYFNPATVSAPASSLTAGAAPTVEDTYTGSKGGYGGTQVSIAPQTSINPFEAYTGLAPEGLVYTPEAIPEVPEVPVVTDPVVPVVTDPDDDVVDHPGDLDEDPLYPIDIGEGFNPTIPTVDMPNIVYEHEYPDKDIDLSTIDIPNINIPNIYAPPIIPPVNIPNIDTPTIDIPPVSPVDIPPVPTVDIPNIEYEHEYPDKNLEPLFPTEGSLPVSTIPSIVDVPQIVDTGIGESTPPIQIDPVTGGGGFGYNPETGFTNVEGGQWMNQVDPFGGWRPGDPLPPKTPMHDDPPAPSYDPPVNTPAYTSQDIMAYLGSDKADVYNADYDIDGDGEISLKDSIYQLQIQQGLRNPDGTPVEQPIAPPIAPPKLTPPVSVRPPPVPASPRPRPLKTGGNTYVEGGQTAVMQDPLTKEVAMFILGESENEEVLTMFIEKYGNETFMQLREMVLQNVAPNSQTEGLIKGVGNGGMDDDISGTIGNKEQIAVSQDEFIVPADVVSMLGDGSSDAGSKQLYDMMDRVRQEKTGTTRQAPKLANAGGLLPR